MDLSMCSHKGFAAVFAALKMADSCSLMMLSSILRGTQVGQLKQIFEEAERLYAPLCLEDKWNQAYVPKAYHAGTGGGSSPGNGKTCDNCGDPDHWAYDCPKERDSARIK